MYHVPESGNKFISFPRNYSKPKYCRKKMPALRLDLAFGEVVHKNWIWHLGKWCSCKAKSINKLFTM